MLECVVNISEGRRADVLDALVAAGGAAVLDVHTDPDHNRTVLTLAGPGDAAADAVRRIAAVAVERIDVREHRGVHPRIGAVDVVPFVPLGDSSMDDALAARDAFATWFAATHGVPSFRYGPERSLPDVRREAFRALLPDIGPPRPHPSAGACAVGARPVLVAYNVWLATPDLALARAVARSLRRPELRTLGLQVGDAVQVSMNLVAPATLGPAEAYDLVAAATPVARAELVGLIPRSLLDAVPRRRWAQLDLGEDRTIEARLARTRLDRGVEPRSRPENGGPAGVGRRT